MTVHQFPQADTHRLPYRQTRAGADNRVTPIRPTTVERKLHARHYIGLERQHRREQRLERMVAYFRTDRARRLVDIACYAMIGWAAAIIAVALIAGAVR